MLRLIVFALAIFGTRLIAQDQAPLRVCATTPNLGAIVRAVVGDVPTELTVLAKPAQDPHYVVARPSYVKAVHDADVLAVVGLDLEIAWIPAILDQARNPEVRPGGSGYFDASTAIAPLEVSDGDVDRSAGDVHPRGNPHFLVDPVRGAQVALALADHLGRLRPESRDHYVANAQRLRDQLGALMVGETLAGRYDFTKLAQLARHGRLQSFLESQKEAELLEGFFARAAPHRGDRVIADHNGWIYVIDRLSLDTLGYLEPRPGIPPTARHLGDLIGRAKAEHAHVLLTVSYFDRREIEFVAENAGVATVALAHEAGALPDTEQYVDLIATNLGAILTALERASDTSR